VDGEAVSVFAYFGMYKVYPSLMIVIWKKYFVKHLRRQILKQKITGFN
jgi:hypothetical protein